MYCAINIVFNLLIFLFSSPGHIVMPARVADFDNVIKAAENNRNKNRYLSY